MDKDIELYSIPILPNKKDRIKGYYYIKNNQICLWDGICLNCKHNYRRDFCKICNKF